ncbi:MAG: glycosyltransferase [Candidatus Magasanikbacteria bacterium]
MKIGIFTDSFTPQINGVTTSLLLLISGLRAQGHEVYIFAPNNSLKLENQPETNTRRYPSILVWGDQVRLAVPMIRAVTVAKLGLDIIHVHTPGPIGMAGTRVGAKLGLPLVYTYHTRVERYAHYYLHLPSWMEKGTLALIAKRFYDLHDAIVAPSRGIKNELAQYITKPITVIPTGINIAENQQMTDENFIPKFFKKYNLAPTDQLLITASRISKEKNIQFVIEAFEKIQKSCPNAKLLIAGNGPDKESLMNEIKKTNQKSIIFLDFLKHEQLFALYRLSKAFLFASTTETQGLVVLEALAMGLPVVALTATGIEDMLMNNIGGFMTTPDQNIFADKAISLISDPILWTKKNQEALRRAQDFSDEKTTGQMLELYKNLIQKKSAQNAR